MKDLKIGLDQNNQEPDEKLVEKIRSFYYSNWKGSTKKEMEDKLKKRYNKDRKNNKPDTESFENFKKNLSDKQKYIYKPFKGIKKWDLKDFIKWYILYNNKPRICKYCGITEQELIEIDNNNLALSKRDNRGRFFEIDRKNDTAYAQTPNNNYEEDNCVFACYWCNNAKSDVFTTEDMEIIGPAIQKVMNKRLKMNRCIKSCQKN